MIESEIIEHVRTQFRFLFDRYAYQVIACRMFANSGNWIVVLESPSCGRFLVLQDRGEIIVALGPHGSAESATDGRWFDLAVLVEYLSRGKEMIASQLDDQDRELTRLAGILRPYMDGVCQLFWPPNFENAQEELDQIGNRREQEIQGSQAGEWDDSAFE